MSEFRQNPLTGQWVVIAPDRANRPQGAEASAGGASGARRGGRYVRECPFCEGNERRTPGEVYAIREDYGTTDQAGWRVRVFPNKYPALRIDAEGVPTPESVAFNTFDASKMKGEGDSPLRNRKFGIGMHEVLVESPEHDRDFEQQDIEQAERVVLSLRHRFRMIMQARDVQHVCVFKNRGPGAGSTIEHPHWQIIAPSVAAPVVRGMVDRQESYAKEKGRGMWEVMLEEELGSGERIILGNDEFVALAPWASGLAYEAWIVPREQAARFGDLLDGQVRLFAAIVQDLLRRIREVTNDADFNLVIHSGPKGAKAEEHHRWFAQIAPRTAVQAGFETGTGTFINAVAPEDAAKALREVGQ